jgi:O-antigen ligase/tetratricopeptide (TPR) repeat protein
MSPPAPEVSGPRWLTWLFLPLLVLPFHAFWADFEQVRRGLLLVLAGVCLVGCRLRPVRGERLWLALLGWLLLSAIVNHVEQGAARAADTTPSFHSWDAVYRLAHWTALAVVLRIGALAPSGFPVPCAVVLVVTSLFGLLQRAGLGEVCGYGVEREPVSAFGNLNVASEFTAVAAMVVAVSGPFHGGTARRWLQPAALVLAGAYLVVNQSRSGLVALPVGLLLWWVLRRRERGFLPLAFALGGAALGLLFEATAVARAPAAPATAAPQRQASTLDVRWEINKGSARLFAENPVIGHGPGQFAVQYARVRSPQEIELSSFERSFPTEVRTAHNDWLELLVDGGLPALVLFALALFALQRGAGDKTRLLPLFVLLLLMLVRSPLGNAPAVAAALLLAGTPAATSTVSAGWRRFVAAGFGLLLVALGLVPIAANCLFAPYQSALAYGGVPKSSAVAAAADWMPFEPRWQQLLAQEQMASGQFHEAALTAASALRLRPYEPQHYLLLGEARARGSKYEDAVLLAQHGLQFDPPNPELRVLLSTVLAQLQRPEEAIAAVVDQPHPKLRQGLGAHFHDLAKLARDRGNKQVAARFAVEQHFLAALDTLADHTPAAREATKAHLDAMRAAMQEAGRTREDLRVYVVGALLAIDLGNRNLAIQAGEGAKRLDVPLPGWQRDLLGAKLEPLQAIEVWAQVLARR